MFPALNACRAIRSDDWTVVLRETFQGPESLGMRSINTWKNEDQPILFLKLDGSRVTMTYNANDRRVGILLDVEQACEVSGITCVDQATGGRRLFERLAVCRDLSVFSRPKCIVSYRKACLKDTILTSPKIAFQHSFLPKSVAWNDEKPHR
jgi:YD repeat-containing protein